MVGCGGRDLCLGRDVRQHAGVAGGFLGAGDPRGEIRARMGRAVGMGTDCGAAGYPPSEASSEGGAMLIRKLGLSGKSVSRFRAAVVVVSVRGP